MKTFDDIWEEIHNEVTWGKYPSEEIIRFVARNYYNKDRKNIKILDFGCGTGAVTWYLARENFNAYGFDGSTTAVENAKKRMNEENLKAKLIVADGGSTPFEDNYFDAIIDSAVIYANRLSGIKQILRECYRILKPNGKIFSTGLFKVGMTGYNTGEKLEENTFREITEGNLAHRATVHFFTKEEIIQLWTEANFKNITIDSVTRTDNGGKNEVSYYIAQADK